MEKLELFAIVELFGHGKIAGKITEQSIGPDSFIRVSVPETTQVPAFDRLFNPKAIYAINPVTEEVMKVTAEALHSAPIQSWDVKRMYEKVLALGNGSHLNNDEL